MEKKMAGSSNNTRCCLIKLFIGVLVVGGYVLLFSLHSEQELQILILQSKVDDLMWSQENLKSILLNKIEVHQPMEEDPTQQEHTTNNVYLLIEKIKLIRNKAQISSQEYNYGYSLGENEASKNGPPVSNKVYGLNDLDGDSTSLDFEHEHITKINTAPESLPTTINTKDTIIVDDEDYEELGSGSGFGLDINESETNDIYDLYKLLFSFDGLLKTEASDISEEGQSGQDFNFESDSGLIKPKHDLSNDRDFQPLIYDTQLDKAVSRTINLDSGHKRFKRSTGNKDPGCNVFCNNKRKAEFKMLGDNSTLSDVVKYVNRIQKEIYKRKQSRAVHFVAYVNVEDLARTNHDESQYGHFNQGAYFLKENSKILNFWKASEVHDRRLYKHHDSAGKVRIKQEGIYLIYAQVTMYDESYRKSVGVYIDDDIVPFVEHVSFVQHRIKRGHADGDTIAKRAKREHDLYTRAHLIGVTTLKKGQTVCIKSSEKGRGYIIKPFLTFWGITKLDT